MENQINQSILNIASKDVENEIERICKTQEIKDGELKAELPSS